MHPTASQDGRPHDDAWSLEFALQAWGSDGGMVPDDDPPEPPVASSNVNVQQANNPPEP
jgi:hypothetical protein